MLSIVYASRATDAFDPAQLVDLLMRSRRNNKRLSLSGMLLYRDAHFMQVLEGPEDAVRERMAIIAADPRHADVVVLLEESADDRLFPAWTMGHVADVGDREERIPELRTLFADLDAGRDVSASLPTLRALIRRFQSNAA